MGFKEGDGQAWRAALVGVLTCGTGAALLLSCFAGVAGAGVEYAAGEEADLVL